MKILAIDFGTKRMGFAVGDTATHTAAPLKQINRKNKERDIDYIRNLVKEYEVDRMIIGYPLNMDGTESTTSKEVEAFCDLLKDKLDLPIDLFDERLTSFEAEEMLKTFQPNFKKRKKVLDSISALIILTTYMETIQT